MNRAVISGVGVVSAFGVGTRRFFDGLLAGRGAVGPIHSFDASAFQSQVGGEVRETELSPDAWDLPAPFTSFIERKRTGGLLRDRKALFAVLAAAEAWHLARCSAKERDAALSIAYGMEQAFIEDLVPLLDGDRLDFSREASAGLPEVRFRSRFDQASPLIAEMLGASGLQVAHASACAGGALAVAHAASLVERGIASTVLCGASDSMLNPMAFGGMCRLGAPSPRSAPDACRPFDRRRDGLVIGEGAAMFVIESEDRALRRGIKPLARVLGWGSTQDAYRLTAPRPDGTPARVAMERAIRRAGISAAQVGYVNAHGTGTSLNDAAEARAIRAVFAAEADRVPVSSIKGAVGHLMAASGAVEIASCLLAFTRGVLPGTANHRERDPECEIQVIGEAPREQRVDVALSNSFGFGGQNATVALGRFG